MPRCQTEEMPMIDIAARPISAPELLTRPEKDGPDTMETDE